MEWHKLVLFCGIFAGFAVFYAYSCNEAVCASLVSKCMLLKSCECNMLDKSNCTCCKDCHRCLAKLYTECCSCVGMCENKNPKYNDMKTSTVEEIDDPIPDLFRVLTEEPDPQFRYTTYTYPAHLDLLYFKPRGSEDFGLNVASTLGDNQEHRIRHGHSHIIIDPNTEAQNCTVAYMAQCLSLNKCRVTCSSMGAARFRWFHEYGCCECISSTCLDYGKGEALCLRCSANMRDENDEDAEEELIEEEEEEYDLEEDTEYSDLDEIEMDENSSLPAVPPVHLNVEEEQVVQMDLDANNDLMEQQGDSVNVDKGNLDATAQLNAVDSLDNL